MTAGRETEDPEQRAREEEQAASLALARARLARERAEAAGEGEGEHLRALADEHDAEAAEHGRRAREARQQVGRERRGPPPALDAAVSERLLALASRLLRRPVRLHDLSGEEATGLAFAVAEAGERLLDETDRRRDASQMLQRALLPEALPVMPGVQLEAAFRPADDIVGGDWYDAFRLPEGRLAFALGDVVGHGLESAVAAAELRLALRTHALEDPDPGFVAGRLNDLAGVRELISYSSLVYGVLDPAEAQLEWISLGHPPLLLRQVNGDVETLTPSNPLLAVTGAGAGFEAERCRLGPGALLLAHTDGLIERRTGTDPERHAHLAALVRREPDPAELVPAIMAALGAGPVDDDVAVLCIRLAEPDD